jgi:hypothetical protein
VYYTYTGYPGTVTTGIFFLFKKTNEEIYPGNVEV